MEPPETYIKNSSKAVVETSESTDQPLPIASAAATSTSNSVRPRASLRDILYSSAPALPSYPSLTTNTTIKPEPIIPKQIYRPIDHNTPILSNEPLKAADKAPIPESSIKENKRPRKYIRSGKYSRLKPLINQDKPPATPYTPPISVTSTSSISQPAKPNFIEGGRNQEEIEHNRIIRERVSENLQKDQTSILNVDYSRPFGDLNDAFDRLLPYHIFNYDTQALMSNEFSDTVLISQTSKIESAHQAFSRRLKRITTKAREEVFRIKPLITLVDQILVKDAVLTEDSPSYLSSAAPTPQPVFERLSSAVPSDPPL